MINRLRELQTGRLRLHDGESEWEFGPARPGERTAVLRVDDFRFYRALALQGTLGAAEAYLQGWWHSDDLVELFRLLTQNEEVLLQMDGVLPRLFIKLSYWEHWLRRNSLHGSRRNIAAHYDLGEEFYSLFLDETLTYSAGVFAGPHCTLEEASREKYDRICRKLMLTRDSHLLEIGTGWGGFALHAAKNYGCKVTTSTISRSQYDYARGQIYRAGLADQVTVLCEDYRSLKGTYDHIVSVEMIEAVGHAYLDQFFRQCSSLLRSDGMLLLQAITIPDYRFDQYTRSVDFIQKYVFPGGCLPSLAAMGTSIGRETDLRFVHLEDFSSHYAETLARWRERFGHNIDRIRSLGMDERFLRLWNYYLCYCEAGFLDNQIGVAQILLCKPNCRRGPLLWQGAAADAYAGRAS